VGNLVKLVDVLPKLNVTGDPELERLAAQVRTSLLVGTSGLYLPSVERRGLGEIVIAVDTSGSIGKLELEQFAGEVSAISEEAQPEAIHVLYCDAAVQSTQEFTASEPVRLEPRGGGGTDFRPAFEWVEKNDIAPVCLIYLTDLCCHSFPEAPEYPVLWVTDSRKTAPFGETVRIGLE
jgi:predicted metal-dependent peptidase